LCACVFVEATSEDDLSLRFSIKRIDSLAEFPLQVAYYVDTYGWSYIEAEHELGKVLIATGVYDIILKAFGYI
jgi:hypothetical protein